MTSWQNPMKAEAFSSLSLMSQRTVHLSRREASEGERSVRVQRARRGERNEDSPSLSESSEMNRNELREDESESTDGNSSILEEGLGSALAHEDLDERLDEDGNLRLEVLLQRWCFCRTEREGVSSRSLLRFEGRKDEPRLAWHCIAISPTAQAALLQTLTSSYLG